MKTKVMIIALLIIGLIGIQSGFATDQAETENTAAPAAVDNTSDTGEPVTLEGVIEKKDADLFLVHGENTFLLQGDKDLAKLEGQSVEVRGILKKEDMQHTIMVEQVKTAQ